MSYLSLAAIWTRTSSPVSSARLSFTFTAAVSVLLPSVIIASVGSRATNIFSSEPTTSTPDMPNMGRFSVLA